MKGHWYLGLEMQLLQGSIFIMFLKYLKSRDQISKSFSLSDLVCGLDRATFAVMVSALISPSEASVYVCPKRPESHIIWFYLPSVACPKLILSFAVGKV